MQSENDRIVADLMEQLIESGPDGMGAAFTALMNLAMRIERERHLGARAYERSPDRAGHANGYKAKKIDTAAGTLSVQVPKSRGGETPFYPQALERGRRSSRAVMIAIAQMYIQGVSTRDVEKVMAEFGLESLSSSQVSRAAALMDEELEAWRTRPLGAFAYLLVDARYEKARIGGVVRDAAILSAVGIGEDGKRSVLGLSVALSEGRDPLARLSRQPRGARAAWRALHHQRRSCRACRCPEGRLLWGGLAAVPVPSRPQRHPPRPERRHS